MIVIERTLDLLADPDTFNEWSRSALAEMMSELADKLWEDRIVPANITLAVNRRTEDMTGASLVLTARKPSEERSILSREYYTVSQAASVLGTGDGYIRHLISNGRVQAERVGVSLLIRKIDFDRFASVYERRKSPLTKGAAVARIIKKGPASISEISQRLGWSESKSRVVVRQLIDDGFAKRGKHEGTIKIFFIGNG